MRGSHQMPLMPVPVNTPISYFDGPPVVSCAAFTEHRGKLTEPADCFLHPFWDTVRQHVSEKAMEMRRQGFVGAAMLPMAELEYTGITTKLKMLDQKFAVRQAVREALAS
jgi:fructose 1,6-bisphosphate aldolase/phosphatase